MTVTLLRVHRYVSETCFNSGPGVSAATSPLHRSEVQLKKHPCPTVSNPVAGLLDCEVGPILVRLLKYTSVGGFLWMKLCLLENC